MEASTHLRELLFEFGALTVTATGRAQAPARQPYTFDNANFWGNSYQTLERQNDPEACARFCDQDPRCAVASFHDATATGGWANKCVLRSEQGSRHPEQVGIRSWVKAPAAGVSKATLAGVSMLIQGSLDPTYSDFTTHPEIRSAVQKLHDVALIENEYCGVRMGDGREYVLISATTSNAELALPHAIAYDRAHQVAFVGRAFASRPAPAGDVPEAFWGRPDPALKLVLTAAA